MSSRKLCVVAMLAAIAAIAPIAMLHFRFNDRHVSDLHVNDVRADGRHVNRYINATGIPTLYVASKTPPAVLLPIQSKSTKAVGLGKILVASRDMGDPRFAESVILLVRYDDQGVVGLVLNRRTKLPISKVLDDLKEAKGRTDKVYVGGPVEPPAVFGLFQSPAKVEGAERIFDTVYFVTAKSLFEQALSARPGPDVFHVYLGYSGWNKAQLGMEVQMGAWYVFPADASMVFNSDPESLWREMIRKTDLKLAWNEMANEAAGAGRAPEGRAILSPGLQRGD